LAHDYTKLAEYIKTSLNFKKKFIEEDEFDKGIRVLLNFAHTFGHSYEVVSNYAIPHGSAVALGMITANNISVQRGYMQKSYAERIEKICHKILTYVEIKKEWFTLADILKAIHKDKKQTSVAITAVLIKKDYTLGVFHDIKESEINAAVKHLFA
jgi:3-dehydroquinate synthase